MVDERRTKRPAYQWHVLDARGDEIFMLMSYEQRGVYRELLDQQWLEGSLPANPEHLAAMLHISPARFAKVWPLISTKFRARDDGRLVNDRMEKYRRELSDFVDTQAINGAKGAAARWGRHSAAMDSPMAKNASVSVSVTKTDLFVGGSTLSPDRSTTRPPALNGPHTRHANCGKVCLHESQFRDFCQRVTHLPDPDGYVRQWFRTWDDRYVSGDRKDEIIGADMFDFWRQRWAESHPAAAAKPVDITEIARQRIEANQQRYGKR